MIVVDVETTGTDAGKHSIVSIGAVDMLEPNERFFEECRVWDGAHIESDALKINGYTEDQIRDPSKAGEGDVVAHFFSWLKGRPNMLLAAQNPMFDLGFITAAAFRAHLDIQLSHRSIDLHTVAYMHMVKQGIEPPTKNKKTDINSDSIMKYVGIPAEPRPHIAINGAIWEAEALSRLLYGRNLFEQFKQYSIVPIVVIDK